MQAVVIAKPYRFIGPVDSRFWPRTMPWWLPGYLRRHFGLTKFDFRGVDRLKSSLDAGHGVFLAPNHARPCDPMVVGLLCSQIGFPCYCIASWHVFTERPRWQQWLIQRLGTFSIHRWGMDREALKACTNILAEAKRPLVLFPEGMITRTNDRLGTLLEGTSFIATSAAKQRAKLTPPGQVVLHPVGLRYVFEGDIHSAAGSVLDDAEKRLSWQPQHDLSLVDRVLKVGVALLGLKEIEYMGHAQTGTIPERLRRLTDEILHPIEREWLGGPKSGHVVERVKKIRTAVLPDLTAGTLTDEESERRWKHIGDCYLAQQIDCYPGDYLAAPTTVDRILETVERFEEDLTDAARPHPPMRVIVQIGEAIPVPAERTRGKDDPLMQSLEQQLRSMMTELQRECRMLTH